MELVVVASDGGGCGAAMHMVELMAVLYSTTVTTPRALSSARTPPPTQNQHCHQFLTSTTVSHTPTAANNHSTANNRTTPAEKSGGAGLEGGNLWHGEEADVAVVLVLTPHP